MPPRGRPKKTVDTPDEAEQPQEVDAASEEKPEEAKSLAEQFGGDTAPDEDTKQEQDTATDDAEQPPAEAEKPQEVKVDATGEGGRKVKVLADVYLTYNEKGRPITHNKGTVFQAPDDEVTRDAVKRGSLKFS